MAATGAADHGEPDPRGSALLGIVGEERLIAEGAGATATAAVLSGKVQGAVRIAAIVSGANIDPENLRAFI